MIAAGAIGTLVRHGIKVPEDVSVMGMDDVQFAHMYCPSISTIAQPYKEMCEKAVECIDKLTKDEEVEQFQVLYPPKLVVRESTAEKS
jgi:LacI family repressor for deo operon, udp, cdd, tsx, nupC, and nupG